MIGSWRKFPPVQQRQAPPPEEDHIWDKVTVEQQAKMQKSAEDVNTIVTSMIDHLPPEQQSAFKNYQKTREESGNQARKP